MEALLAGLNPAQHAAVTTPANAVQVLAPPGSGKTNTLTARVAWLIAHCGLAPWNIIVCTFTVKAASEMRRRLDAQVGEEASRKLVMGTFHGVSRRYLQRYGEDVGLRKGWGIADAGDQKAMIKRIVRDQGLGIEPGRAQGRISACKARGKTAGFVAEELKAKKKGEDEVEFVTVYSMYEAALELSNLLDFDDLLLKCKELLEKFPHVVAHVEAVLVDEFQDTNEVQFELMRLFAQRRRTITIVGDPDQSIYGWRNAEIENLNKMKVLFPDTLVIFLEENYRSSAGILSAAQTVIEQDKARPDKKLQATHGHGEIPVLRRLPTAEFEAKWLVSEIQRTQGMCGPLLEHKDFAILLRSAQLSRHVETALGNAGMPYRMVGGTKFYDRVEIKILLDYLRVVERHEHSDAVLRVLNVPPRQVGEVTIKKLYDEATSKGMPLWKVLLATAQGTSRPSTKISAQAEKGITEFVGLVISARKKADAGTPADVLELIITRLGYERFLMKKYPDDHDSRWANVEELQVQTRDVTEAIASGMLAEEPLPDPSPSEASPAGEDAGESTAVQGLESPLSIFLANIALSSSLDTTDPTSTNCITISTIHAAKGLEWPVVYVPACYQGSIPHSRAEDSDEERRLLYVAMTRAQGLLYLSCPMKNGQSGETQLSNFLDEGGVVQCFNTRGPELEYFQVSKLATVLGRPCPSLAEVNETRMALPDGWEDTYWPEDGSMPEEELNRWDRGKPTFATMPSLQAGTGGFGSKHGFIAAARLTAGPVEGFSVGFGSARDRMFELEKAEEERKVKTVGKENTGKANAVKAGGDIKSFFGSIAPVDRISKRQKVDDKENKSLAPVAWKPAATLHQVSTSSLTVSGALAPTTSRTSTSNTSVQNTSMAALHDRTAAVKRTLGLRREFKPWSARTNK